jgi:RimJ/RimL family protein N-acetyltransferase
LVDMSDRRTFRKTKQYVAQTELTIKPRTAVRWNLLFRLDPPGGRQQTDESFEMPIAWHRFMWYFHKIEGLLKDRGGLACLRFVFGRIVHRHWRSRVYRDDAQIERVTEELPSGYRFEMCSRPAEMTEATKAALKAAGGQELQGDLDLGDRLYFVWHGPDVASYGGIFDRSPQRHVLGLPESAVLVGCCYTVPQHRQMGLYRFALNETARRLRSEGIREIFIEVSPNNRASIRGIEAAGFAYMKLVDVGIWCGRFMRRDGAWHWLRKGR